MFTLAHLSDPHLPPLPEPRIAELIGKRITGYVNWRRKRRFIHDAATLDGLVADMKAQTPDHIAVTGDLANLALPAEYPRGRDWLDGLGTPNDVTVIPGNHDVYVADGAPRAVRYWGAHMSDDDGTNGFPFVRRRGNVALIGLSSGVPTAPFLATGWLGTKQLLGLAETLTKLKTEDVFRVVLIHHPPVSEASRHKRLLDADVLKRVIALHGAELLLHGHDHLHMLNWLDGPDGTHVPTLGVPSASAKPGTAKDAAAYNLYAIDGTRGAWTCEAVSRGVGADGVVRELGRVTLAPQPSP